MATVELEPKGVGTSIKVVDEDGAKKTRDRGAKKGETGG